MNKTWKLMCVTRGGTVSLIRDLTKTEAEFMRCRLLKLPATPEEVERKSIEYNINHPLGPNYENNGEGVTKEQWTEWHKKHPSADGCRFYNGSLVWRSSGAYIVTDSDITSVEIFE